MENSKADSNHSSADQVENSGNAVTNVDNNNTIISNDEARAAVAADGGSRRRTAFTDLSQEEADLALARTLQDQERAYMMLRRNTFGDAGDLMFRRTVVDAGSESSWETVSGNGDLEDNDLDDDHEEDEDEGSEGGEDNSNEDEDAFDANSHDAENADSQNVVVDPSAYSSDEAFARALQDAEEREMAARMMAMAGIHDMVVDGDENDDDSEEEDGVDPDELSYEELIALGEVVGTQSRGLSVDTIDSLPWFNYKAESAQNGSCDSCVICRLDYEEAERLTVLPCKHSYHSECIYQWLDRNKVCPVCNAEVSTSGSS